MINKIKSLFYKKKYYKVLEKIRAYKKIDGWLTEREAYGLYNIASKLKSGSTIVEIGSWKGKSTFCLASGLRKGTIYAIDPFNADGEAGNKETYESKIGEKPLIDQFKENTREVHKNENIIALQGYSQEFVNKFSKIDLLFIDGDHSIEGCKYDFENFSKFIPKGGYIALHDFYEDRDELGPTWVVKNLLKNNNEFRFFRQYNTLWIAKKIK